MLISKQHLQTQLRLLIEETLDEYHSGWRDCRDSVIDECPALPNGCSWKTLTGWTEPNSKGPIRPKVFHKFLNGLSSQCPEQRKKAMKDLFYQIKHYDELPELPAEDLLYALIKVFLGSEDDLGKYNQAHSALLGYLRNNVEGNEELIRLTEAYLALRTTIVLKELYDNWDETKAEAVRQMAVGYIHGITDPYDKNKFADFIRKALSLDTDIALCQALKSGSSFTLMSDGTQVHMLRYGLPNAFEYSIAIVNALKVLDQEISFSLADVQYQELTGTLAFISNKIQQWWLTKKT